MTSPTGPARPGPPTAAEIADLTARLRNLTARGAGGDPVERAEFLTDKHALIDRITTDRGDAPAAGDTGDADNASGQPWTAEDAGSTDNDGDGPVRPEDWAAESGPVWPVLPDWVVEQAARVEAEIAAGNTLVERPDDLGELAERIGELRAAHGPARTEETLTHGEAVERLTALGYDRASARVMVGEYLDDTSRAVGVSAHPWSLDQYDVDAIAEQYRWISMIGDHGLTNLAQAREIAAARAESYGDEIATVSSHDDPDATAAGTNLAYRWADRARIPEPFTDAIPVIDGDGDGATDRRATRPDEEQRREQLVNWHADDQTADAAAGHDDGRPLGRATYRVAQSVEDW